MDVAAAADPTYRAVESTVSAPSAAAPPAAPAPTPEPAVRVEAARVAAAPAVHPGVPTLPPATGKSDGPISDDVIKLFNQQQQNVEVSYRVEKELGEVVTVFTDKTTGKTIVQFPSETLIALAKLFDKIAGSVLDKKA